MNETITFEATIPGTQTAIQIHGSGGMRIVLDIPDSQVPEAIQIMTMTKYNLRVTIEKLPHETYGTGKPPPEDKGWLRPNDG